MRDFENTTRTLFKGGIPEVGDEVNFTDYSETRMGVEGFLSGVAKVMEVHFHGLDSEQWVDVTVRMHDTGHWSTFRAKILPTR